jgi:tetratricopeptide (TPR) repeat protein
LRHEVVRVVDGVATPGRFIDDIAYAAFAMGAELEARGFPREAFEAYLHAAARDPESVEVWTRVGATGCAIRVPEGERAFSRAETLDPSFEPLWRERALCHERRGNLARALSASERATALDPEREDTVLVHARLLARVGRRDEAQRWLEEASLRAPSSVDVWVALVDLARERRDPLWAAHAEARLNGLLASRGLRPRKPAPDDALWEPVDAALIAGDLAEARRCVRRARIDARLLAARAIAVGRPRLALAEADLRLQADPDDSDARVALALAADLSGQAERAADTLAAVDSALPLGEIGRLLLTELLWRHVGKEAAALVIDKPEAADGPTVDLALRLRARLTRFEEGSP